MKKQRLDVAAVCAFDERLCTVRHADVRFVRQVRLNVV